MTRPVVPSEAFECRQLVGWLGARGIAFTHIANERADHRGMTSLGVSPGFPDYLIVTPRGIVFVEMKNQRGGKISREQHEWLARLSKAGHDAVVCNGFAAARVFLEGRGC